MLAGSRIFQRKIDSFSKVFNSRPTVRCSDVANKPEEKIVIPARIDRKPTDILKALASTVNFDPTAFHYKFPDDPYFYTYASIEKKVYALALESGRKSAKWIVNENPGFFKHQLSDPLVQDFIPKLKTGKDTELSEQSLLSFIEERDVSEAIKLYESLKSQNCDVSQSTKQSLLELVCFYNGKEKPAVELESKWLDGFLGRAGSEIEVENRGLTPLARILYQETDVNCPLANSALILGYLRNSDIKSGFEVYESARSRRIKLSVNAYNAVLSAFHNVTLNRNEIRKFITETLCEMAKNNVMPDLGTLNGALNTLSRTSNLFFSKDLLKEFEGLGIEPSLGSYAFLFRICARCRPDENLKALVENVMAHVENKQHEVLHPSDLLFFQKTMEAFVEGLKDADLALRLINMYLKPDNRRFVVRASDEHGVFKQLYSIAFKSLPLDQAMEIYRRYTFSCFCPESSVLSLMIKAIHKNFASDYLAEVWKDMGKLGYCSNRIVLGRILDMMPDMTDEISTKVFHEAAINFTDKFEDFRSGDEAFFPNLLQAFVANKDDERINKTVDFIEKNYRVTEFPESTGDVLLSYAMAQQDVPLIVRTLKMATLLEFSSTSQMAEKALPLLTGPQEDWARTLVTKQTEGERKKKKEEAEGGNEGKV